GVLPIGEPGEEAAVAERAPVVGHVRDADVEVRAHQIEGAADAADDRRHAVEAREAIADALEVAERDAIGDRVHPELPAEAHAPVERDGALALSQREVRDRELRAARAARPVEPAEAADHASVGELVAVERRVIEAEVELDGQRAALRVTREAVGVAERGAPAREALVGREALVVLEAEDLVEV